MHSILIGQTEGLESKNNNSNSFFYSLDSDKKCGVLFYRDSILKQNPLIFTHCGHIGYIYPKHFGGDDDDDGAGSRGGGGGDDDDPKPDKSGDKDAD